MEKGAENIQINCFLVAKSRPALFCDPMDCSPPDTIYGISQAKILEWVAISFSRGSSQPRNRILYC